MDENIISEKTNFHFIFCAKGGFFNQKNQLEIKHPECFEILQWAIFKKLIIRFNSDFITS